LLKDSGKTPSFALQPSRERVKIFASEENRSDTLARVTVGQHRFDLLDVRENPGKYVNALSRAKSRPGYAVCHCIADGDDLKLQIRRHGQYYHLARWPNAGNLHAESCCYFETPAALALRKRDSLDAIILRDGGLNANLAESFQLTRTGRPSSKKIDLPKSSGVGRRRATLLAYLQTLWIVGGLTRRRPNASMGNWGACYSSLLEVLDTAIINGKPAQSILHVIPPFSIELKEQLNSDLVRFLERVSNNDERSCRRLVLGELGSVVDSKYGKPLTLRQNHTGYFMSSKLIDAVQRQYRSAWPMLGRLNARVLALLVVERTPNGNLRIADMALQLCNRAFIQCDSSHEVDMANLLLSQRRSFEKPMRLGDGDEMLPDFILVDTPTPTHIEVYGMNGNPNYERRKKKKTDTTHPKHTLSGMGCTKMASARRRSLLPRLDIP